MNLNNQEITRRRKLYQLITDHVKVYNNYSFDRKFTSLQIKEKYNDFSKLTLQDLQIEVSFAGRLKTKRDAGKIGFAHLQDFFGLLQIYINQADLNASSLALWKQADIGDFYGIVGIVMKTDTGELTIKVTTMYILSKALKPLPDKFHGLIDIEERYRKRYLDLIMNESSKQVFLTRTKIINAMRLFLTNLNSIEVETPILQPLYGGTIAKPFMTKHNSLDMNLYLRIAPELYLKRLIVGGFESVFEIGKVFRNEGLSTKHNPEFTMLELYIAYFDLWKMMDLAESMVKFCIDTAFDTPTPHLTFNKNVINFTTPWRRVHMVDYIKEITGVDFWPPMTFQVAQQLAIQHQIELQPYQNTVGHIIALFFEKFVEDTIIDPTYVYGFPVELSPLSSINYLEPRFVNRFELYIMRNEIMNAYEELNHPIQQYENFKKQLVEKELGNHEAGEMDHDFVETLEYGMPPTVGLGVGIDRLVMLLTDSSSIKDVIFFPQMKHN